MLNLPNPKLQMELNLSKEQLEKIENYVKEGRFKSVDDFISQAANLLLYAEERKEDFKKILKIS